MALSIRILTWLTVASAMLWYYMQHCTGICLDPLMPCEMREGAVGSGAVVLVTGSSSGVGAELAMLYARRGAHVVLTARREGRLRDVAARCQDSGAASTLIVVGDARESVDKVAKSIRGRHGRLDVLILNHAAIPLWLWEEEPAQGEALEDVMATNFFSSAALTRRLLPLMTTGGGAGRIAVIGSMGTFFYPGFLTSYISSKAAVTAFFNALRVEFSVVGRMELPSITQIHLGEIATEHHIETTQASHGMQIAADLCAAGIARGVDRRLVDAFVPSSYWVLSFLGSAAPLRPLFFELGFLSHRPAFQKRVDVFKSNVSSP